MHAEIAALSWGAVVAGDYLHGLLLRQKGTKGFVVAGAN